MDVQFCNSGYFVPVADKDTMEKIKKFTVSSLLTRFDTLNMDYIPIIDKMNSIMQ